MAERSSWRQRWRFRLPFPAPSPTSQEPFPPGIKVAPPMLSRSQVPPLPNKTNHIMIEDRAEEDKGEFKIEEETIASASAEETSATQEKYEPESRGAALGTTPKLTYPKPQLIKKKEQKKEELDKRSELKTSNIDALEDVEPKETAGLQKTTVEHVGNQEENHVRDEDVEDGNSHNKANPLETPRSSQSGGEEEQHVEPSMEGKIDHSTGQVSEDTERDCDQEPKVPTGNVKDSIEESKGLTQEKIAKFLESWPPMHMTILTGHTKGASMSIGTRIEEPNGPGSIEKADGEMDGGQVLVRNRNRPGKSTINSNSQGVNNSILSDSCCTVRAPGVHIYFAAKSSNPFDRKIEVDDDGDPGSTNVMDSRRLVFHSPEAETLEAFVQEPVISDNDYDKLERSGYMDIAIS